MSKYVLSTTVLVVIVLGYVWYQNSQRNIPSALESVETANQEENDTLSPEPNDLKETEYLTDTEENLADNDTIFADPSALSREENPDETTVSIPEVNMPNQVVIDVDGSNYEYSVKEIKVKRGDVVTINLRSTEGFHDWVVDEFGAASERINEGEVTSITFVADKVGTFQYYCSVGKHRQLGMIGYLTVEE